jgi:uroporphyrinogen decarboxylase
MNRIHQERVAKTLSFQRPDRTPRDFAAVPEIWSRLAKHLNAADRPAVLAHLDIDCRVVSYDSFCQPPDVEENRVDMEASQERSSVGGMWRRIEADGSNRDIWGAHRQRVANPFGELDQFVSYPLAAAGSIEELKKYHWPTPEWWDFSTLRQVISAMNDTAVHSIRYRVGSVFETAWSLYSFEKFLLDMAIEPDLPLYVMERITEVHVQNLQAVLSTAADLIDIVYFYDDLASQNQLLMRPEMYDRLIRPFHARIIALAQRFGKPVMIHCCGAVYPLISRFIDMGISILNPIQPMARDMAPEKLAREFGGRIAYHGGIDIQGFLPRATPAEVKAKVEETCEILGSNGGYILAGSHHIQADTPVENILAMYSV